MNCSVLISVRLHDGRYHGTGDWPPSPARLFQALVAGAAQGDVVSAEDSAALGWLEQLSPPEIKAPSGRRGQRFTNYVPNNDLDAVGSDPRRVGEVRAGKVIQPYMFDAEVPFLYAWRFEPSDEASRRAGEICALAKHLYQLGRGVDMACAWGEVLDDPAVEDRLARHGGALYHPTQGSEGSSLDCPIHGSLESLWKRFAANGRRFSRVGDEKEGQVLFSQPPKPRFRIVGYNSPPVRQLFELRNPTGDSPFNPCPLVRVSELALTIRDKAVERLEEALPSDTGKIKRVLIGRGATDADKAARVRIVPLPSAGRYHVDPSIRRVLVEVPSNCPVGADDVAWAFSGLVVEAGEVDPETGEITGETRLVPAGERTVLTHYGVNTDERHRQWRTVTPAALPERTAHRRIDARRLREEVKGGVERTQVHQIAATSVMQALRHAGTDATVSSIRVQREPFEARGARAEDFAGGTRFAKERLWHVEITLAEPVAGPLILGDGRYLGLGLMAPMLRAEGVHCFSIIAGLHDRADAMVLARALRRAVMARAQEQLGRRVKLPSFFSGHEPDGGPSRSGRHAHLALAVDLTRTRLLVVAPHVLEGRSRPARDENEHLELLDNSLADLGELRAGPAGLLELARSSINVHEDPLFAPTLCWESVTEYQPTRHVKHVSPEEALLSDVRAELMRRRLPVPTHIEVIDMREGPRGDLAGRLRLHFAIAVSGLIMIGRTRHIGGGLFSAVTRENGA